MLWAAVQIAAPILIATMVVGILVSVIQVVTQIQEVSLSFIPKIITLVIVLVMIGPWMLKRLVSYSSAVIGNIPSYM